MVKLYRVPRHDKYICRDCGNLLYTSQTYSRPLVEAFERLDEAKERIHDGWISQEDLREFYDAKTGVFSTYDDSLEGLDDKFSEFGSGPNRANQYGFTDDLPPFEVWADRLFHRAIGAGAGAEIRPYGHYGRCTATVKTTSEQCGQPAFGDHGKCYYHGGAAGSGIGDGQTDHAAERITHSSMTPSMNRPVAPSKPGYSLKKCHQATRRSCALVSLGDPTGHLEPHRTLECHSRQDRIDNSQNMCGSLYGCTI